MIKKIVFFFKNLYTKWNAWISLGLIIWFSFTIGYLLALVHAAHSPTCPIHSGLFPIKVDDQIDYEEDVETLERIFTIFYYQDDEIHSVKNLVRYPNSWKFEKVLLHDDENTLVSEQKMYKITSPDQRMVVLITPYNVDYTSNILSVQTTLKQEILKVCLIEEDIELSTGLGQVKVYREPSKDMNFKYTQEILSSEGDVVSTRGMNNFVVYNRANGIDSSETIAWVAEISVKFSGEPCEVQEYILLVDEIIKSLQVIN